MRLQRATNSYIQSSSTSSRNPPGKEGRFRKRGGLFDSGLPLGLQDQVKNISAIPRGLRVNSSRNQKRLKLSITNIQSNKQNWEQDIQSKKKKLNQTGNQSSYQDVRQARLRSRPQSSYVSRVSMFRATENAIIHPKFRQPSMGLTQNFKMSKSQSKDSLDSQSQSSIPNIKNNAITGSSRRSSFSSTFNITKGRRNQIF